MKIRIHESFRAVFYTPFYLPHALGTYAEEGLDVTLHAQPTPNDVTVGTGEDGLDLYWGGPMRLLMDRDQGGEQDIVGFCEIVTRDPFMLIGREPRADFALGDLCSMTLATVSEVPTPWMCLQEDLRRAGVNPAEIARVTDRGMAENSARLRAGDAEVIQVYEPHAEALIRAGHGHLWYAAANRGPCSYTTMYAARDVLARHREPCLTVTRALYRAQKWLHRTSAETIATTVQPFFPSVDHIDLSGAIARYLSLGIWGRNPILSRSGFERLSASFHSGGMIASQAAHEACVNLDFAETVIAEDPPPAKGG